MQKSKSKEKNHYSCCDICSTVYEPDELSRVCFECLDKSVDELVDGAISGSDTEEDIRVEPNPKRAKTTEKGKSHSEPVLRNLSSKNGDSKSSNSNNVIQKRSSSESLSQPLVDEHANFADDPFNRKRIFKRKRETEDGPVDLVDEDIDKPNRLTISNLNFPKRQNELKMFKNLQNSLKPKENK